MLVMTVFIPGEYGAEWRKEILPPITIKDGLSS